MSKAEAKAAADKAAAAAASSLLVSLNFLKKIYKYSLYIKIIFYFQIKAQINDSSKRRLK
jgi:hypothetical protein